MQFHNDGRTPSDDNDPKERPSLPGETSLPDVGLNFRDHGPLFLRTRSICSELGADEAKRVEVLKSCLSLMRRHKLQTLEVADTRQQLRRLAEALPDNWIFREFLAQLAEEIDDGTRAVQLRELADFMECRGATEARFLEHPAEAFKIPARAFFADSDLETIEKIFRQAFSDAQGEQGIIDMAQILAKRPDVLQIARLLSNVLAEAAESYEMETVDDVNATRQSHERRVKGLSILAVEFFEALRPVEKPPSSAATLLDALICCRLYARPEPERERLFRIERSFKEDLDRDARFPAHWKVYRAINRGNPAGRERSAWLWHELLEYASDNPARYTAHLLRVCQRTANTIPSSALFCEMLCGMLVREEFRAAMVRQLRGEFLAAYEPDRNAFPKALQAAFVNLCQSSAINSQPLRDFLSKPQDGSPAITGPMLKAAIKGVSSVKVGKMEVALEEGDAGWENARWDTCLKPQALSLFDLVDGIQIQELVRWMADEEDPVLRGNASHIVNEWLALPDNDNDPSEFSQEGRISEYKTALTSLTAIQRRIIIGQRLAYQSLGGDRDPADL